MRLSLGVGWMVLIAEEMLAQNPGLGKFVWDEFQNGSSPSLARIMFAVVVIGLIGFLLDQMMRLLKGFDSRNAGISTGEKSHHGSRSLPSRHLQGLSRRSRCP